MSNRHIITFLTIIFLFSLNTYVWGKSTNVIGKTKARILVIHSFDPDYASYPDHNRMIANNLRKEGIQAEIKTFYLDCEQYAEVPETQRIYNYIDSVSSWKPDLILVNDDQATYSLLSSKHPMLKEVPIVFVGVNFPNWGLLQQYTEITGSWDKPDYLETVNMIEQLMGETRIRFFHDNTFLGKQVTRELSEQLKTKYPRVSNYLKEYLRDQESLIKDSTVNIFREDSLPKINRPDSTTFYFIDLRVQGRNGLLWTMSGMVKYAAFVQTKYDFTSIRIGRMAAIPTFTVINEGFDYNQGVLGGYFSSIDIQAEEGAQLAARILKGEKASSIPVQQSRKKHLLDWNELMRWRISPTAIPDNYELVNVPLHIRYRVEIITIISLLSIFILSLISYLAYLYSREGRRKREAQLNLQKEKEFLSLALEGSDIFAWKYDHDIFSFDKDFFECLKIPRRIYTREQIWHIIHPESHAIIQEQFLKVKNGEQEKASIQCRCNFNGQGYVWYEFRYIKVGTSITGLILNIQDYKDKERSLTEAKDLATKAELKQSFLANMSHEIRTPLNAIVGFSNLLMSDDQTKEERQEFINIINRNCESLLKLIGDILEISRIESNNLVFTFQTFNLNGLLEDIYSTHQMMMPPHVKLLKSFPATPVIINSDKLRLNQVITNLINNAVKFTDSGHIMVGCQIDEDEQQLYIYVHDTGKGIPQNEQQMIFERFYKRDEFAQGTGLGLAICLGIVKKLGGEIKLESKEEEGSKFTIILPYHPQTEKQEEETEKSPYTATGETDAKGEHQKTLLIAEDNEGNYMLLKTILHKQYNLIWVKNGLDAIKMVEQYPIDLILMDIKMPEMNGLEALKEIRKTHKHLPVIMQTAYAFDTDKQEAVLAGCTGFITKPVMATQLIMEIEQATK